MATVVEMAFAGHCGLDLNLDALADSRDELTAALFNEELGAVIQVRSGATPEVLAQFSAAGLEDCVAVIGQPVNGADIELSFNGERVYSAQRRNLQRIWSETSYRIQRLRDNADCADQEFDGLLDEGNPGLSVKLSFDVNATSPRLTSRRACVRRSPSCASRASTVRWKWLRPSTAPASPPSTCT
jgi:phosphoribosylformylglycinamidine synthase (EC 6.3.5.3)